MRRYSIVLAASLVPLACSILAIPACEDTSSTDTAAEQLDFSTDVHAYTVNGIIETLPSAGPPPTDLKIRHEHIPDFVGKTGQVHMNPDGVPGMKAMAMDFPLIDDGVSLEGLARGDKVRFTFKVKWLESPTGDKSPRWLVSALEPLPADTSISFDNKPANETDPATATPKPDPSQTGDDDGP